MKKQTIDIIRRDFPELEKKRLQEVIIERAKKDKEKLLKAYDNLKNSRNGQYVAADLFKELFVEFNQSRESRSDLNEVVHNSAAALSNAKFNENLNRKDLKNKDTIVFLTGIPGAGKTSYSSVFDLEKHPNFKMIFEGQLSNPRTGIEKIRAALDTGHKVNIVVFNPKIEQALNNTYHRFNTYGRGANIAVMAKIQGNLNNGLKAIHDEFGNQIDLKIIDSSDKKTKELHGWKNLDMLSKQGNEKEIYEKLSNKLLADHQLGRISQECMRQAGGVKLLKERNNFEEKVNEVSLKALANKTMLSYERKSLVEEIEKQKKQREILERELVQTKVKKKSRSI